MRRSLWIVPLALASSLAAFVLLKPAPSPAGPDRPEPAATPVSRPPFAPLPVARVVLFSSGVGYFQREGTVEGNARIDLAFPAQDVNDLLKSLVLQDLGGGHASAVGYDSRDPVEKTLKGFALDLTNSPSVAQILTQARGEKVEV